MAVKSFIYKMIFYHKASKTIYIIRPSCELEFHIWRTTHFRSNTNWLGKLFLLRKILNCPIVISILCNFIFKFLSPTYTSHKDVPRVLAWVHSSGCPQKVCKSEYNQHNNILAVSELLCYYLLFFYHSIVIPKLLDLEWDQNTVHLPYWRHFVLIYTSKTGNMSILCLL